jgi:cellulose biosynthesis protein BcsQ
MPVTSRHSTGTHWIRSVALAVTIAFFNNKGGVGKTTLACNFAAYLAAAGRRVLVLDLDPQCNSTQLVLTDEQWSGIYEDVATSDAKTIMGPLTPIRSGDSTVDVTALPIVVGQRFGLDLLPGHPSLSIIEDTLGTSWAEFGGGAAGGARRTAWLRALCNHLNDQYDVLVIDVSPSLGAINRTALIGADYFLTPMSADLFSLYALDNIAVWLHRWIHTYQNARRSALSELEATGYEELLPEELPVSKGFVGYTVQQYVSRSSGGEVRHVKAYDQHRGEIPNHAARLVELSRYSVSELELGTVPNMFAMIPLAQSVHAPIMSLTPTDGLRGAQVSQQQRYAEQLDSIFQVVADRIVTTH